MFSTRSVSTLISHIFFPPPPRFRALPPPPSRRLLSAPPSRPRRSLSNWAKFVDALKGKELGERREGSVGISKEALRGLRETELMNGTKQRSQGSNSSSSNPKSSHSNSTLHNSANAKSPPRQAPRRPGRSLSNEPGSLASSTGHLPRVAAPRFPIQTRPTPKPFASSKQPELKGLLPRMSRDVWEKPIIESSESSTSNYLPKTILPSRPELPFARKPVTSIPSRSPSPVPSPALSTSTIGLGARRIESKLARRPQAKRVSEVRFDLEDSVELDSVHRLRRHIPSSLAPSSMKPTQQRLEKVLIDVEVRKAAKKESNQIRIGEDVEAQSQEKISEPDTAQSTSTLASSPQSVPDPDDWITGETLARLQAIAAKFHLHRRMHWMVNPSFGDTFYFYFSAPHTSITRRAALHASHLDTAERLALNRSRQDALEFPTKGELEDRKLVDAAVERSQKLDFRLLEAKEGLFDEQRLNLRVIQLNDFREPLRNFKDKSFDFHRSIEHSPVTERQLAVELDRLVDSHTHLLSQPLPSFPPPFTSTVIYPRKPLEALLFSDAECTKEYYIPIERYLRARTQGPSVKEKEEKRRVIRKKEREIKRLFKEIASHGWKLRQKQSRM
ncbi:uncharacterized protein JCM6883_001967 [Sporobolomyces salmoneus]|uniref:uncharacterized protein n=1 Tax=Sporobolomyces salmoneus TaxID=183962 RepID=UPI00317C610D